MWPLRDFPDFRIRNLLLISNCTTPPRSLSGVVLRACPVPPQGICPPAPPSEHKPAEINIDLCSSNQMAQLRWICAGTSVSLRFSWKRNVV